MLESADVVLLLVLFLIMALSRLIARRTARRHAAIAQKYRLYKVRDDLVYLVAQGKLRESDPVFQEFYKSTNYMIGATNLICLRGLIAALKDARKKKLDPAEFRERMWVHAEVRKREPAVVEVAASFYKAILEILMENSWVVRLVGRYPFIARLFARCATWLKRVLESTQQGKAYRYYQDYSSAANMAA